jgi:hypothetical protein
MNELDSSQDPQSPAKAPFLDSLSETLDERGMPAHLRWPALDMYRRSLYDRVQVQLTQPELQNEERIVLVALS